LKFHLPLRHRLCMPGLTCCPWSPYDTRTQSCNAVVGAGDGSKAAFDYFIEFAVTMPLLSVAAVAPDDMPQVELAIRASGNLSLQTSDKISKQDIICVQVSSSQTLRLCLMQTISLFAVQPTAIQQYNLAAALCCPEPQADSQLQRLQQPVVSPSGSSRSVGEPSMHHYKARSWSA
jgi:hypothetical protein